MLLKQGLSSLQVGVLINHQMKMYIGQLSELAFDSHKVTFIYEPYMRQQLFNLLRHGIVDDKSKVSMKKDVAQRSHIQILIIDIP